MANSVHAVHETYQRLLWLQLVIGPKLGLGDLCNCVIVNTYRMLHFTGFYSSRARVVSGAKPFRHRVQKYLIRLSHLPAQSCSGRLHILFAYRISTVGATLGWMLLKAALGKQIRETQVLKRPHGQREGDGGAPFPFCCREHRCFLEHVEVCARQLASSCCKARPRAKSVAAIAVPGPRDIFQGFRVASVAHFCLFLQWLLSASEKAV